MPRGTSAVAQLAQRRAHRRPLEDAAAAAHAVGDARLAQRLGESSVWAWVRTSTAWSAHGRPGAWAWRTARATATASARSVAWAVTDGSAPEAVAASTSCGRLLRAAEHRGGGVEDLRGRPVAALELDHLRRRPVAVDVEQEAGVGAVPAVDGLLRVADREHVVAGAPPRLEQPELQRVHVLELVDEEVAEAPALGGGEPVVLLEGSGAQREQVVEVDQPGALLVRLVGAVALGHQLGLAAPACDPAAATASA